MTKRVSEVIDLANKMFEDQKPMLSLYQTLSDHFYPERADFTVTRNVGQELADSIVDSYPILVRRDLGNSFASMLRDGDWFDISVEDETDYDGRMWLQFAGNKLKRLMNHRTANFVRATKEGDHDYATFGQCVISVERNRKASGLLYRCWHLRDCAWFDGCDGHVAGVARKWAPRYHEVTQYFGTNAHKEVQRKARQEPFKELKCYHVVLPSEMYGDDQLTERFPYVSLYIDITHQHMMEVTGLQTPYYVVPRFQTIAGSPYAYSPATVVGLPDARALQAMTYTLLEAAERYARPPIIATQNVIRSDVDLSADGITWVDKEYDEKLGAALRTLPQDRGGFPISMEMRSNIVDVLSSAFYINKLTLPEASREMTAYEVQERMKQYRRENLPLFSPIEAEYNGQLCELSFELAMNAGMLGSPYDIPDSLRDREVQFRFESPLSQSDEEKKASLFSQTAMMLAEAAQFDPSAQHNINFDVALRDAISGLDTPQTWMRSMEEVLQFRQADQAKQQAAEMMSMAEQMQAVEMTGVA